MRFWITKNSKAGWSCGAAAGCMCVRPQPPRTPKVNWNASSPRSLRPRARTAGSRRRSSEDWSIWSVRVDASGTPDFGEPAIASKALVVALPTRGPKVRRVLPENLLLIPLRVRSARESLEGQSRPAPDVVVSIVSRSLEIRQWVHALLIAVGLPPDSLYEVDAARPGWQDRISRGSLVVTDVVTACDLPAGCEVREYRVIADSSISELKQLCSA